MAAARIKIFKRNCVTVDGRDEECQPTLYHTCWCETGSLYGKELYSALEVRLENTIIFEVRYCRKVKEIRKKLKDFYVEYEGDKYDIFAFDCKKNDKQYVQLKANMVE